MQGQQETDKLVHLQNPSIEINGGRLGLEALQELPGVFIKQQYDLFEEVTGCDTNNIYHVYRGDQEGKIIKEFEESPLFKVKDLTPFCSRCCLTTRCRSYDIEVKKYVIQNQAIVPSAKVMSLKKEKQCIICCCSRPILDVYLNHNSSQADLIGRIQQFINMIYFFNPFLFCNYGVQVLDDQNKLKYTIEAGCCQKGILCPCPCQSCNEIHFVIKDDKNQIVANLTKISLGCMAVCMPDSDKFQVQFPQAATPADKVLIVAGTLFLDYMYFEKSSSDKNQSRRN